LLSDWFVLGLCAVYALAVAPIAPGFASPENAANVLAALFPLFVVALGQPVVLIAGGIDLSVTAIIGLTSITGGLVMNDATGWLAGRAFAAPAGIAVMLVLGTGLGLAQGFAVARLRLPAFIVTLAGMTGFGGLAVWLTASKAINQLPPVFTALGGRPVLAGAIAAAAGVSVHLMLSRSLFGRWLHAVGHNPRAAGISGVPVAGVTIAAFAGSGLLAAVAAVLLTGQAETASPVLGQRLLLDIIGAAVIGGTSLFGGRGKVLWTLSGVLFLKLIDNSLNLLNLSLFTITMVKGAVILLAAGLDTFRTRLAGSRA
jgi:ribose/xylose/arabinose/galactoside ABC-type transport system permease subunit